MMEQQVPRNFIFLRESRWTARAMFMWPTEAILRFGK